MSEPGPKHPLLRIPAAYWIHRAKIPETRRTCAYLIGLFIEECVKVIHKYREIDWGDGSGSKVHDTQAWELSLSPRNLHNSQEWRHMLLNPMLKRQSQELQAFVGQPAMEETQGPWERRRLEKLHG